jgi:hypothetical protein
MNSPIASGRKLLVEEVAGTPIFWVSEASIFSATRISIRYSGRVLDCPVPEPILDQARHGPRWRGRARPTALATRVPASKLWPKCRASFFSSCSQAIYFGLCCADTSAVAAKLVTFITWLRADGDHEGE